MSDITMLVSNLQQNWFDMHNYLSRCVKRTRTFHYQKLGYFLILFLPVPFVWLKSFPATLSFWRTSGLMEHSAAVVFQAIIFFPFQCAPDSVLFTVSLSLSFMKVIELIWEHETNLTAYIHFLLTPECFWKANVFISLTLRHSKYTWNHQFQ